MNYTKEKLCLLINKTNLNEHEKYVMMQRLYDITLERIAREMGYSRERIRQIEAKASRKFHIRFRLGNENPLYPKFLQGGK